MLIITANITAHSAVHNTILLTIISIQMDGDSGHDSALKLYWARDNLG